MTELGLVSRAAVSYTHLRMAGTRKDDCALLRPWSHEYGLSLIHIYTYGKDFAYEGFADMWKAEHFDPQSWAKLFKRAGAGYVVLTTKHHDGFCLWPSEYTDYNAAKHGPGRDLFGELTTAVRGEGLHMGAYY